MARQLRIEYEGALCHVTSRGNARQDIFQDDQDRNTFLGILEETVERYRWYCHAYCLMGNHYHLVIETRNAILSSGMRHLNGVYTQKYNRRHKKVGHLFQGRFKSIHVEKEAHLQELIRYVVLNPVRAGMVKSVGEWKWSSYRATAGEEKVPLYLWTDWILSQFGRNKAKAMKQYKVFVEEGAKEKGRLSDRVTGQVYLGSEAFINLIRGNKEVADLEEIPSQQDKPIKKEIKEIIRAGGTAEEIKAAVKEGHKMKEIARYLEVHYSTVTQRVKRSYGSQ